MSIISTKNLIKEYTRFEKEEGLKGSIKSLFNRKKVSKIAVENFDLEIDCGEFVGLIGPNGAGKTSLMKMLTGIIAPSRGRISVLGFIPGELKNNFKKQFAIVMGQKSQLFYDISASDTFLLLKEIYEIPEKDYKDNINYFVELFDLKEYLNVPVRTLSLGERMKMELVAALIHNPKILFLDEPTIGLDVVAQKQIRIFLREVNKEKKTTILLTSHYMDDIRSLCKRSIVINDGKKVYDGDLYTLLEKYQKHKVITIMFNEKTDFKLEADINIIEKSCYKVKFTVNRKDVGFVVGSIVNSYEVEDISIEEEDIGNVIEKIYENRGRINDK